MAKGEACRSANRSRLVPHVDHLWITFGTTFQKGGAARTQAWPGGSAYGTTYPTYFSKKGKKSSRGGRRVRGGRYG